MMTRSAWLMAKVAACDATPSRSTMTNCETEDADLDGVDQGFFRRFFDHAQGWKDGHRPLRILRHANPCPRGPFHLRMIAIGVDAGH